MFIIYPSANSNFSFAYSKWKVLFFFILHVQVTPFLQKLFFEHKYSPNPHRTRFSSFHHFLNFHYNNEKYKLKTSISLMSKIRDFQQYSLSSIISFDNNKKKKKATYKASPQMQPRPSPSPAELIYEPLQEFQ